MADENKKQEYVWSVELRENKITERTDDYTASVKTFSDTKSLEYIAKEIVRERTEYREDIILSIMKLVEEKIRHVLYSGYPVMTENVRFSPTITGSFDSHGELLDDISFLINVFLLRLAAVRFRQHQGQHIEEVMVKPLADQHEQLRHEHRFFRKLRKS